jgi:hypothetical protein
MVPIYVDAAFRCQQVKRCEPQIIERFHGPAVPAICINIPACEVEALFVLIKQLVQLGVDGRAGLKQRNGLRQSCCRGGRGWSVLLAKELLRLHRPGHQLAIQA